MRINARVIAAVFLAINLVACSGGEEGGSGGGYIDTHMHLNGLYNARVVMDYETAADNLVAAMDASGVSVSLVMPPPQNPGQAGAYTYTNLAPAIAKYPDRLALVAGGGTLNPLIQGNDSSAVTDSLKAEFETKANELIAAGARGFGEMTSMHLCMDPDHHYIAAPADHPLFLLLADISARTGLPIDMHMEAVPYDIPVPAGPGSACSKNPSTVPATVPAFERLLAHNRGAKIVWQHVGWDNTGYMTAELVGSLLAAHSNLYIAVRVEERLTTQVGTPMPNRIVDDAGTIKSEWLTLFNAYPERFMIGGDDFYGIPGVTNEFPASFAATWAIIGQLPASLQSKIGGDNAAAVYASN